jgi:hypothetical protein
MNACIGKFERLMTPSVGQGNVCGRSEKSFLLLLYEALLGVLEDQALLNLSKRMTRLADVSSSMSSSS